ncbi:MAG: ABC transporter ATP-binding protein [Armatimonadetes bacterium]|nr:ABC transporter ATP-binding protein [Armatimonadota bacterium]
MARECVVRTLDVVRTYGSGDAAVHALAGITCEVFQGEYVSIMGPSGSGKSTLFNMIGGLDKPTSGSVFVNGVDIAALTARELAFLRCHTIGYIFQTFNLITVRTALENVTLPMLFAGKLPDEAEEKAMALLDRVGLGNRYHHRPSELSGGQQQRVAIARALANSPAIILADEPTGNLDLRTGKEIIELLKELNSEQGVTIVSATHDLKMLDVSDRIFHIRDGMLDKVEERLDVQIELGTVSSEV